MQRPLVAAIIGAALFVVASPRMVVHCCSAGSKPFEIGMTSVLTLITFLIIWRLPTRKLRILAAAASPIISFFIVTGAYDSWIHGPSSPWPAIGFEKITVPLQKSGG